MLTWEEHMGFLEIVTIFLLFITVVMIILRVIF